MRRTRAMAGLLTLGLLAGLPTAHAAERGPGKPTVGECRHLSAEQAAAATNATSTISCSSAHNARVFAVPTLPQGVHWSDLSKHQVLTQAVKACTPGFHAALGQNDLIRDRTAYSWAFFIPDGQQRANGARWFRCDLLLLHGSNLADLPTDREPALPGSTIPTKVKRCLTGTNLLATPCAYAHRYRTTGSFVVSSKRFPGRHQLLHIARARCPAYVSTDRDFRFTFSAKVMWNAGHNHVVVCYSHTMT